MKKIYVLCLALFCFATFYSCMGSPTVGEPSKGQQGYSQKAPPAKAIPQKNDSLTIWFYESSLADTIKQSNIYKDIIDLFQSQNPSITITLDTVFTNDETALNRANTEIMAGNGPDVLLCSTDFNTLKSGIYEDMTPFMQSSSFDEAKFLKGTVFSGKFYDKQYLVPISFEAHVLVTSEQALKNINAANPLISAAELGDKITQALKNGVIKEVYGAPNNYEYDFQQFLGIDLIDYEFDKINLNTPESKAYFENAKAIINSSWTHKSTNYENNYSAGAQKIASGDMLFIDALSPNLLLAAGMAVNYNSSLVFMPMRNEQLEIIARPTLQAGICSMSSNKQIAYNFIEALLSEDFQGSDFLQDTQAIASSPAGFPVRISAFEKRIKESDYPKGLAIFGQEFQKGDYKELSEEQLNSYIDLMNSGMEINFFRTDYYSLLNVLKDFVYENASLDNILSDFENKLKIKMNE